MHSMHLPRGLTRRRMAMALPLLGSAAWLPSAMATTDATVERSTRSLMGTQVDIVAHGAPQPTLQTAVAQAWQEMARLASLMTRYSPDSIVSRINRAAGVHAVSVPAEVMPVLQAGQKLAVQTQGAFDITVGSLKAWHFGEGQASLPTPQEIEAQRRLVGYHNLVLNERTGTAFLRQPGMALDLGGVAKLPILEAGMKMLQRHGVEHALLNGGGDVLIAGQLHGRAWRVGLRDPHAPERMLGMLELQGQAIVASSGDYERFFMVRGERQHHILNPATGRPTHGPHGVSLLARDAASVNGLGTAIMVMGSAGAAKLLQNRPEIQAALVAERDQSVWQTPGMAALLRPVV